MTIHNAPQLLKSYRIFYIIVFLTVLVGGFLFAGGVKPQYFPFFILLILPTITPFLVKLILETENPEFFYYYVAALFIFTGIYTIVMPKIGLAVLGIFFAELILSTVIGFLGWQTKPAWAEFNKGPKKPEEKIDLNWQPPAPPVLSPKAVIYQRISEAEREILRYTQKLTHLQQLFAKSQTYLKEVDERLNYPHLSSSNRQTSLKLQEMLQTSLENYRLMIRFFEEARMRYEREKRNLNEKLGNLEIIAFLNDADRMEEISSIEKVALDIEFQEQLRKLENELPFLNAEMDAKTELLTHDLKEELTETIERLQLS